MTTRPVIHTAKEFGVLLPQTGASQTWKQFRGAISSKPEKQEGSKGDLAQNLAQKTDAYINKAEEIRNGIETDPKRYETAKSEFYQAFRERVEQVDCKAPREDVLVEMLSSKVQFLHRDLCEDSRVVLTQKVKNEALYSCIDDVAKRCADELFSLASKETSDVNQRVGKVPLQEAEKKIKENLRGLMQKISESSGDKMAPKKESTLSDEEKALQPKEKEQELKLSSSERQKIDSQFRSALQKALETKVTDLKNKTKDDKELLARKQRLRDEFYTEGVALHKEINQGNTKREGLEVRVKNLNEGIKDTRTSESDRTVKRAELQKVENELKELRKKLTEQVNRYQTLEQFTNSTSGDPLLKLEVEKRAKESIGIWEKIAGNLNAEVFPEHGNQVVEGVANAANAALQAPEQLEKGIGWLEQTARKKWSAWVNQKSGNGPSVGERIELWNKRVSECWTSTKEKCDLEGDRFKRGNAQLLKWNKRAVMLGAASQGGAFALNLLSEPGYMSGGLSLFSEAMYLVPRFETTMLTSYIMPSVGYVASGLAIPLALGAAAIAVTSALGVAMIPSRVSASAPAWATSATMLSLLAPCLSSLIVGTSGLLPSPVVPALLGLGAAVAPAIARKAQARTSQVMQKRPKVFSALAALASTAAVVTPYLVPKVFSALAALPSTVGLVTS